MPPAWAVLFALALGAPSLSGCAEQRPALDPAGAPTATADQARPVGPPDGAAGLPAELPEGGLRSLVPQPSEVPAGLVPLPPSSGPRDAAAVAAFSGDPAAAAAALAANGFRDAYVAQYAATADSRSLTVVVVRFASPGGARADLEADVAEGSGTVVEGAPALGEASDVRRVELPGSADELVTVRVRAGATTWLVAWRAPGPADVDVPLEVARSVLRRA